MNLQRKMVDMLDKVKRYAEKWDMLTNEDCVIVGVSGGADSICLLLMLLELQKEIGFDMVAVHVNHGLRGEDADADETFVKHFCREREVPIESYSVDLKSVASERKQSTEEAGREVRREFFEQARIKHNGTKIALAHHQNDNAETFLFRLARGTGVKGLGGMAPVKGRLIRPLLCVDRSEIETYLENKGISYCTDITNESDEYTRNRIRNHIIPCLVKQVNSQSVHHICETMEHVRQVQDYLEQQAEGYMKECVLHNKSGYLLAEDKYREMPEELKPLLLKKVLLLICQKEKDIEAIHLRKIQELFDKQTGRCIHLPYQMEAKRVYEGVEIYQKDAMTPGIPDEFLFDLEKMQATYLWGEKKICCRILNKMQIVGETLEKSHTKRFDCDIIKNSISFRTRRPGDYITIHPDGRTQKLKAYFINEKIPQEERDKVLLVADGSHILWIVGYRVNCAYQVTKNTNSVLEIHVDKGEENGRES